MGNPMTSASFSKLLEAGLREAAENTYNDLPSMIDTFYRVLDSDSAFEEFAGVGDLGDIPELNGKITFLSMQPAFSTRVEPKEFAAGISFERKLIDDKKYNVLNANASSLMKSAARTREKHAALPFQNAFSTAFDFMTSEEGVSLCSDSHASRSGASTSTGFDNKGTSALSATSVATARITMKQFRSDIGERIDVGDNLALIVPDALADTAFTINGTKAGLGTPNSDINPQAGRYKVIPYSRLDDSDTNNWFMVDMDKMKQFLIWIDRVAPEANSFWDKYTFALQFSVYFRIAYCFTDWRWIVGNQVA